MRNVLIMETLLIQSSTIHIETFREKYSIEYDSIKDNKKQEWLFFRSKRSYLLRSSIQKDQTIETFQFDDNYSFKFNDK